MIKLKPGEEHLREALLYLATNADPANPEANTMRYGQLVDVVDPDGALGWKQGKPHCSKLITALWHVNSYEVQHGRPMIGAFSVTRTRSSLPGFAAAGMNLGLDVSGSDEEFWRDELDRSVAHWSAPREPGGLSDVQFDAVMAELAAIKRLLRQVQHAS